MRRVLLLIVVLVSLAAPARAMHIAEGLLPAGWAGFWFLLAAPCFALGLRLMARRRVLDPGYVPLVGLFGAAVFVFSCFPIPVPIAGTTSHPAGTGLSAVLLGPLPSVVVAGASLLLQALFLAHGGLTTLGANTFSMGVLGSCAGWLAFRIVRRCGGSLFWGGFAAGAAADLATYFGTALALALALHGDQPVMSVLGQLGIAFLPTQVPLCLLEGTVTGFLLRYVQRHRADLLQRQGLLAVGA